MEFELIWVDPSLVVCRTSELADLKGYEELMRALSSSPEFGPDVKLLMDHTALDASALTAADLEEIATIRARYAGDNKARSAMVVGSGSRLRFGLGRMFEAFMSSQAAIDVRIFEEFDDAIVWLQADDAGQAT